MDLRPFEHIPIHKVGGNLEEKLSYGTRDCTVPVFTPSDGLLVIIDRNDEINQTLFHPFDVLFTRYREPLCCAKLGM